MAHDWLELPSPGTTGSLASTYKLLAEAAARLNSDVPAALGWYRYARRAAIYPEQWVGIVTSEILLVSTGLDDASTSTKYLELADRAQKVAGDLGQRRLQSLLMSELALAAGRRGALPDLDLWMQRIEALGSEAETDLLHFELARGLRALLAGRPRESVSDLLGVWSSREFRVRRDVLSQLVAAATQGQLEEIELGLRDVIDEADVASGRDRIAHEVGFSVAARSGHPRTVQSHVDQLASAGHLLSALIGTSLLAGGEGTDAYIWTVLVFGIRDVQKRMEFLDIEEPDDRVLSLDQLSNILGQVTLREPRRLRILPDSLPMPGEEQVLQNLFDLVRERPGFGAVVPNEATDVAGVWAVMRTAEQLISEERLEHAAALLQALVDGRWTHDPTIRAVAVEMVGRAYPDEEV